MPEIQLDETDRLDWALKAFKKKMQKSGILATLRRKRYYTKPSEARQIKSKAAQRARHKAARARRHSS
jgi:small subunit ribosomal protein S21